jgi:GT2 family glycosyltransferase
MPDLPRSFRILIVVPTLGRRMDTLERTLASISAQDDISVDAVVVTPVEDESLRCLVERHGARQVVEDGHISAAVNRGFRQAGPQHRYVGWIGDDDLLRPGALAASSRLLEQHGEAVVAFGQCDYIDMTGRLLFTRRPPLGAAWWLQFVPGLIKQETCLFRREAVLAVGGLDESLRYAMDLDLLLRLRRLGSFVRVDAVQAAFCWHADSITVANREMSFVEAQRVQRIAAHGLVRLLSPFAQPLVRHLLLAVNDRINRRYLRGV